MSHSLQRSFCEKVTRLYPDYFHDVTVIDVGSLDINGNNRGLFVNSKYIGIDLQSGNNVDIVGLAHKVIKKLSEADVVISTEALEHDRYYDKTLSEMYSKLRSGGLMLITCAGDGRAEHGTSEYYPEDSPGTNDYYQNISNQMFRKVLPPELFSVYFLAQTEREPGRDLQFYGIKL